MPSEVGKCSKAHRRSYSSSVTTPVKHCSEAAGTWAAADPLALILTACAREWGITPPAVEGAGCGKPQRARTTYFLHQYMNTAVASATAMLPITAVVPA